MPNIQQVAYIIG